jgi:hypothetical protein
MSDAIDPEMRHTSRCRFAVKTPRSVLDGEKVEALGFSLGGVASASSLMLRALDVSAIPPGVAQEALAEFDRAMPALRRFRRELRRRVARVTVTDGPTCRHCDGPMPPSSPGVRLYCSRSCRQRAYEARRLEGAPGKR